MSHDAADKFELNYLQPNEPPSLVPTREFEKKLSLNTNFPSAGCNTDQLLTQKWVVHIHAYYREEVSLLFDWLRGSVNGATLIVTTDSEAKKDILERLIAVHSISEEFVDYRIVVSDNSGRNVSALVLHSMQESESCDLVLHLHTKRSTHNSTLGTPWFRDLVTCLANSNNHVTEIRQAFATHQNLGIVIPRLSDGLRQFRNWGQNYKLAKSICSQAFPDKNLSMYSPLIFPAGMMFWFRPQAMKSFRLAYEKCMPLPGEPLAIDGTSLHALERIVLHACEQDGFAWAVSYPEKEQIDDMQLEPHNISVWEPRYDDYLCSATDLADSLRQTEKDLGACKAYLSKKLRSPIKRILEKLFHSLTPLSQSY